MNFKRFFWGFLPAAVALSSCDKVSQPLKQAAVISVLPTTPPDYIDSSKVSGANSYTNYKLLLEDLTGHFCVNCPIAAKLGDSIIDPIKNPANAANIIYMQENMGFDAVPAPGIAPPPGLPSYAFTADYRTIVGNTWLTLFNPVGYPMGVFDRTNGPTYGYPYPTWGSVLPPLITPLPTAKVTIDIHDSCWVSQRIMGATFKVNIVNALPGASYLLETVIIEDSIFDWQSDNSVALGYDSAFCHRNVLRGAIGNNTGGSAWGTPIPNSVTSTSGASWSAFQTYDFKKGENGKAANWNLSRCYIVAFVCNAADNTTPYAVVQAEMIKVE